MVDLALLLFAFALGLGTFFSPCSIALLPAYVAYFAGTGPGATATVDNARRQVVGRGLRFAGAAALGILTVFAVFGALIYLARHFLRLPSHWLGIGLSAFALVVALVIIALGALMIAGRGPSFTPRISAPKGKTLTSMFAFGALYAFASLGCTLPLFFAVLAQVFLVGPAAGTLLLAAFAVGFAGLMFAATVLLTLAERAARRILGRIMPYVKSISGGILILAGLYIVYYYLVLAPAL